MMTYLGGDDSEEMENGILHFSRLQDPPFVGPESDIYSHGNKFSDLQGLVSPALP
jgi:hypothetical protein